MEKRIKPKTQRGRLNERVKRIEFLPLPFFPFFFLIFLFLQANSVEMIFLENLARQSILLVRLDKSYDRIRTGEIIFRNEINADGDKGKRAEEKTRFWNIWKERGRGRKKEK